MVFLRECDSTASVASARVSDGSTAALGGEALMSWSRATGEALSRCCTGDPEAMI